MKTNSSFLLYKSQTYLWFEEMLEKIRANIVADGAGLAVARFICFAPGTVVMVVGLFNGLYLGAVTDRTAIGLFALLLTGGCLRFGAAVPAVVFLLHIVTDGAGLAVLVVIQLSPVAVIVSALNGNAGRGAVKGVSAAGSISGFIKGNANRFCADLGIIVDLKGQGYQSADGGVVGRCQRIRPAHGIGGLDGGCGDSPAAQQAGVADAQECQVAAVRNLKLHGDQAGVVAQIHIHRNRIAPVAGGRGCRQAAGSCCAYRKQAGAQHQNSKHQTNNDLFHFISPYLILWLHPSRQGSGP